MCLESSWIKFPSLSLFITLMCFSVAQFLLVFFLTLTPHFFLPLYYYSSCYWSGLDRHFSFLPFPKLSAHSFGRWAIFPRYCWQEAESCVKLPCRPPLSLVLPASNNASSVFHHPCLPALLFIFKTCLWLWCVFSGKFGLGSTSLTYL